MIQSRPELSVFFLSPTYTIQFTKSSVATFICNGKKILVDEFKTELFATDLSKCSLLSHAICFLTMAKAQKPVFYRCQLYRYFSHISSPLLFIRSNSLHLKFSNRCGEVSFECRHLSGFDFQVKFELDKLDFTPA